mgnify:CR=1 FL=1
MRRETLGKAAREHAVAGEDVGEISPEHRLVDAVEQLVAEGMARAAGILGDVAARAHHHVRPVGDQRINLPFNGVCLLLTSAMVQCSLLGMRT